MTKKPIYDLTSLNTYVRITVKQGSRAGGEEIVVSDFPSDSNPINIEDFESGSMEFDVNGDFYRKVSVNPITVSLTLIPNSDSDKELNAVALKNTGFEYNLFDMDIHYCSDSAYNEQSNATFVNGILRSVTKGFSISGEGRIETRVYTFQFPPPGFGDN